MIRISSASRFAAPAAFWTLASWFRLFFSRVSSAIRPSSSGLAGAMTFPASTICRAYSDRVSLLFAALCCRVCIWAAVTRKRTVSECFAAAVLGGLPPLFFRFSAICEPVLVQRMAARPTAAG